MSVSWDRVRTWSVESAGSIDRDMEVSKTLAQVCSVSARFLISV